MEYKQRTNEAVAKGKKENQGRKEKKERRKERKERKKTNHKQLDSAILKYKITYLEQMLLICDGKLFKIFPKQGKRFQLQSNKNTPEAMADETT